MLEIKVVVGEIKYGFDTSKPTASFCIAKTTGSDGDATNANKECAKEVTEETTHKICLECLSGKMLNLKTTNAN